MTINEAYDVVRKVTGYDNVIYLEARHEVKRAVPDPTHSIELFGYMDKVSFEDGVRNMWGWVNRENKVAAWYEWDEFELDKGIDQQNGIKLLVFIPIHLICHEITML